MTLVLTAHGRHTLWVLVDRRLSYGSRRPPIDDAIKVLDLSTLDGVGVLAYAGLGATAVGSQPSEWMSNTLRGHGGLTFEQALSVVADAAVRELPRHLVKTPGGGHSIVVPAFIDAVGPRLYSIEVVMNPDPKSRELRWRYTSHQRTDLPGSPAVRMSLAGTGGAYLNGQGDWQRHIRRLVKASDAGKVSDDVVADEFAKLNHRAHLQVADGTVGPRCIVIWRRRHKAPEYLPASAQRFYTGTLLDSSGVGIPAIGNGMDVRQLAEATLAHWQDRLEKKIEKHGSVRDAYEHMEMGDADGEELNRLLSQLPWGPDDKLR